MQKDEAWKRAWELAAVSSEALQEVLSIKPYTHLGELVPMTEADLNAYADAKAKYEAAERAWLAAAMEALRLS
jgi:hypothetical protein